MEVNSKDFTDIRYVLSAICFLASGVFILLSERKCYCVAKVSLAARWRAALADPFYQTALFFLTLGVGWTISAIFGSGTIMTCVGLYLFYAIVGGLCLGVRLMLRKLWARWNE